jgi:N-acetylmuramoyl-L-alanine amidase
METIPYDSHDEDAMGRTIWGEARGEPSEGQVAVAWVILNRASRHQFAQYQHGRTGAVAKVCYQPLQFSCWNEGDPNREKALTLPAEGPQFKIAKDVLAGAIPDPTNGADHYYVTNMKNPPYWASMFKVTAVIGAHTFLDSRTRVQV